MRYHPANTADLASHQAMLALLAEDVAHIDPALLERAIDKHVAASPFMPKAAELIAAARNMIDPGESIGLERGGPTYAHDLARAYNRRLEQQNRALSDTKHWIVAENGELKFVDRGERGASTRWNPPAAEITATRAVIADLIQRGVEPHEFKAMVERGAVTNLVEQRMAGAA